MFDNDQQSGYPDLVNRREILSTVGAVGIAGLAGCSGSDGGDGSDGSNDGGDGDGGGEGRTTYAVGAATSGSTAFVTTQAIQRMLEQESDIVGWTTQETQGGVANLRLYDEGQYDVTGTVSKTYVDAMNNAGPFEDNPIESETIPQGFTLAVFHIYLMARDGTGIETVEDMRGANVFPIQPGFSTRAATQVVLEEYGIWDDLEIFNLSNSDVPGALEEERVDVLAVYGSNFRALSGWVQQVDARSDLHAIDTSALQETVEAQSALTWNVIEPYGWQQDVGADEVGTWTSPVFYVFRESVPDEHVAEMTRLVHDNPDVIRESFEGFIDTSEPENLAQVLPNYPIHPGAAQVYKDIGVWEDDWIVAGE